MPTEIEPAAVAADPEPAQVAEVPGVVVETRPAILHPSDLGRLRAFVWGDQDAADAATWLHSVECYPAETSWCPVRGGERVTATVTFDDPWSDGYLEYSQTHPYVLHNRAIRIGWWVDPDRPDRYNYPTFEWIDTDPALKRQWQGYTESRRSRYGDGVRRRRQPEDDMVGAAMARCGVVEACPGAAGRAEGLLLSILDGSQREMFHKDKSIIVRAESGRRYRIKLGTISNVEELDDGGKPTLRLCVHPLGVPDADVMATQKLMIETNEEEFRRMANIHDARNGQIVQRAGG